MKRILLIILFLLTILLLTSHLYSAATQPAQPHDAAKAHIRQMINLGTPELAEAQARDLIARGDYDPLAIGVMAYAYAARGEMGAAIQQLKMALHQSRDEIFLLRTAGQFVAWYDTALDRSQLTPTDVQALEWIRANVSNKPAFADAYRALSSQPMPPAPPVAATPPTAAAPTTIIVNPPQVVYEDYPRYIAFPIFTNPFKHFPHERRRHVKTKPFSPERDRASDVRMVPRDGGRERVIVRPPPTFRGMTPQREPSGQSDRASDRGGRMAPSR